MRRCARSSICWTRLRPRALSLKAQPEARAVRRVFPVKESSINVANSHYRATAMVHTRACDRRLPDCHC
ncbi:hypothetical protein PCAR4_400094 [Paraburkholderia caribensis]|nr:hypothetical protein PCAR4_400094 [Paraburkholderia caribensis]